jgi:hypothetical protein
MQPTDDLKKPVRLGALSMAKISRALLDGPCSIRELKVISGLSTNTLHEYMRALRKEQVVHICGWEKDATGRESLRVFKLGAGRDAPRSKKSKAQIAKECRKRKQDAKLTNSFANIGPITVTGEKLIRPISNRDTVQPALR